MFKPIETYDQECFEIYGVNWITNFDVLNTSIKCNHFSRRLKQMDRWIQQLR